MPQMMPISWLTLYLFFIIILFIFSFINYFSFIPTSIPMKKTLSPKVMNWKW
uniref:ATP synthase complex subunit 8 n=1 Tax=Rhabdoblatta sp. RHA TaxID=2093480 RepID=A0A2P1H9P2_9NEOP|nr:ATP synthase F0 subunit 8 [Rhabdoblatta sp. RHA]